MNDIPVAPAVLVAEYRQRPTWSSEPTHPSAIVVSTAASIPVLNGPNNSGQTNYSYDVNSKLLTAFGTKPFATSSIGLKFRRDKADGATRITGFGEACLFSQAPLELGDEIVAVNGVSCAGARASDVRDLFSAQPRDVSLTVAPEHLVTLSTTKSPTAMFGVRFKKEDDGILRVHCVFEDSPFYRSKSCAGLAPGDRVASVCSVDASDLDVIAANRLLGKTSFPKQVSIAVKRRGLYDARALKNRWKEIGVSFAGGVDATGQSHLIVSKVARRSLLRGRLLEGSTVVSVNGVNCFGETPQFADDLFSSVPPPGGFVSVMTRGNAPKVHIPISQNRGNRSSSGGGFVSFDYGSAWVRLGDSLSPRVLE